ncbi:hypothetical protein F4779DRAFT_118695 [Xylariaceae sp. FL0662B]|nr:hypothetical protein F4779DRAFT_118695 [Xylariaceae sp. FL0662B]
MPALSLSAEPISSLLTVVITTSPTPSAPSTELVSAILSSFSNHCVPLLSCRVIVVFDTYDRVVPQQRLKKGLVTPKGAADFDLYKQNVKDLILNQFYPGQAEHVLDQGHGQAEYGYRPVETNLVPFLTTKTADSRITFIEPLKRLGFGLAIRSALRMTGTPFVWVQQHDWPLISNIPLAPILDIMKAFESDENTPVRYICLPSVRMLSYAESAHVLQFPQLRRLTSSLKRDFHTESHPGTSIHLTPLFFWHDKPHLASTKHYLSRVFPSRLAMPRGAFIEDTVGQRARGQMKEGNWAKWASWLYYPDDGRQLCLRHLQGRTWEGAEKELEKKAQWIESNTRNGVKST